jgi:hypothetical protein
MSHQNKHLSQGHYMPYPSQFFGPVHDHLKTKSTMNLTLSLFLVNRETSVRRAVDSQRPCRARIQKDPGQNELRKRRQRLVPAHAVGVRAPRRLRERRAQAAHQRRDPQDFHQLRLRPLARRLRGHVALGRAAQPLRRGLGRGVPCRPRPPDLTGSEATRQSSAIQVN